MIVQQSYKNTTIRIEMITDKGNLEKSNQARRMFTNFIVCAFSVLSLNSKLRKIAYPSMAGAIVQFMLGLDEFRNQNHANGCDCDGLG